MFTRGGWFTTRLERGNTKCVAQEAFNWPFQLSIIPYIRVVLDWTKIYPH